jgi:hypothetical protein
MKRGHFAIFLLLILPGCKRDNIQNGMKLYGHLILSRTWFTDYPDTARVDSRYEWAKASIDDGTYNKDAGSIVYGDSTLHFQTLTYFYYSYNPDSPVVSFNQAWDGEQSWHISGNTKNNIPAFTATAAQFPSFLLADFDSLQVVHKSQPFTISWDSFSPCDSIQVGIYQENSFVQTPVLVGNISSVSFSPSQLSTFQTFFSPSVNAIIIEGWSYTNVNVSGIPVMVETYARRNWSVKIVD